jgi:hypothetical protein
VSFCQRPPNGSKSQLWRIYLRVDNWTLSNFIYSHCWWREYFYNIQKLHKAARTMIISRQTLDYMFTIRRHIQKWKRSNNMDYNGVTIFVFFPVAGWVRCAWFCPRHTANVYPMRRR